MSTKLLEGDHRQASLHHGWIPTLYRDKDGALKSNKSDIARSGCLFLGLVAPSLNGIQSRMSNDWITPPIH